MFKMHFWTAILILILSINLLEANQFCSLRSEFEMECNEKINEKILSQSITENEFKFNLFSNAKTIEENFISVSGFSKIKLFDDEIGHYFLFLITTEEGKIFSLVEPIKIKDESKYFEFKLLLNIKSLFSTEFLYDITLDNDFIHNGIFYLYYRVNETFINENSNIVIDKEEIINQEEKYHHHDIITMFKLNQFINLINHIEDDSYNVTFIKHIIVIPKIIDEENSDHFDKMHNHNLWMDLKQKEFMDLGESSLYFSSNGNDFENEKLFNDYPFLSSLMHVYPSHDPDIRYTVNTMHNQWGDEVWSYNIGNPIDCSMNNRRNSQIFCISTRHLDSQYKNTLYSIKKGLFYSNITRKCPDYNNDNRCAKKVEHFRHERDRSLILNIEGCPVSSIQIFYLKHKQWTLVSIDSCYDTVKKEIIPFRLIKIFWNNNIKSLDYIDLKVKMNNHYFYKTYLFGSQSPPSLFMIGKNIITNENEIMHFYSELD